MPGSIAPFYEEIWGFLKWIIIFMLGLLGWNVRRQVSRIDDIEMRERSYISRTEFNNTVKELRKVVQDGNSETHRRLDAIILSKRDGGS